MFRFSCKMLAIVGCVWGLAPRYRSSDVLMPILVTSWI